MWRGSRSPCSLVSSGHSLTMSHSLNERRVFHLVFLFIIGCSSSDAATSQGGEDQACYANGTCNKGLTCASNVCVVLPGNDGGGTGGAKAGSGGAGGASGASGSGGSSGASGGASGASGASGQGGGGRGSGGTTTGGSGGSPTDAGAGGNGGTGAEAGPRPTEGGLHVVWTLVGAVSGSKLNCSSAGGTSVQVVSTPTGSSNPQIDIFPCSDGSGDALPHPFGSYTVDVELLDSSNLSLGRAPVLAGVTLAASPCDRIVSGDCMKDENVVIAVDGL